MKDKNLVTLSGFGWEAVIAPQCGMNTIRLSHNDKQILRYPENLDMLFSGTASYGSPLLVPPNRTERATFRFDGQAYYLPLNEPRYQNNIHGQLRASQFRVEEKTKSSVEVPQHWRNFSVPVSGDNALLSGRNRLSPGHYV